jgi:ribosomal protein S18 acetylase RimI-like enzyme
MAVDGRARRGYAALVMTREFNEVIGAFRRAEATGADETGAWSGGVWIRTRSLPLVYDANRVIVLEHGFGLSMDAVSAAADEIQSGLPNRIVEFVDCAGSRDLAAGFARAGWLEESLGVMVRRRQPDRWVDTSEVRVVDQAAMGPARTASMTEEAWELGDAVAQVREKQERVGRSLPTTHLAVLDGGRVVSYCEVFDLGDGVAQVESVATLPAFRDRGYARAVVTRALELTCGQRLVFLNMDPGDWPQQLYAKLGFDAVAKVFRFRRALPGSR